MTPTDSSRTCHWAAPWLLALAAGIALPTLAQPGGDETVLQAREAFRTKDRARLASARSAVLASQHPLASWVAYWELNHRLTEAQQPELDAFYARWPGSYVEDRLRNDWLLELGRRRDWANFRVEFPRFRMNDDRDVSCYALLVRHLDGQDVRSAGRAAWWAQREGEEGCALLGSTLFEAGLLSADDAWQAARLATEFNRPRAARASAGLVTPAAATAVSGLFKDPAQFLKQTQGSGPVTGPAAELALLALVRLAAADPQAAALQLEVSWQRRLPGALAATAWAHTGKQAAMKMLAQAAAWGQTAWHLWALANPGGGAPAWSDDLLAWQVRAALRLPAGDAERWALVSQAIEAMSPAEQRDSAWSYWKARATLAQARPGAEGDAARASARQALDTLAGQMNFYGKLATEDLGRPLQLPAPPQPLAAAERAAPRAHPGLARALKLIDIGLRPEGVREWNFSLRGMADRELLAAAQWACEREVWDRCINTSDRTRGEIDMAQRFPTPYREQVLAKAREVGVDPAFMYGLIRQESRFVMDARSHVGASGLMQVMPATAAWTAKKIGLPYQPAMIADRDVNLRLGASYLKLVLDDFGGSQALAAAAYNAGPSRPRRWREGATVEPAAWAEGIPFAETRDYVKKVLSNAVYYAALLAVGPTTVAAAAAPAPAAAPIASTPMLAGATANPSASAGASASALAAGMTLKGRLGPPVGPRGSGAAIANAELP